MDCRMEWWRDRCQMLGYVMRFAAWQVSKAKNGCSLPSMAESVVVDFPTSSASHHGSDQAVSIPHPTSPCDSDLACPTSVPGPCRTVHQPPSTAASDGNFSQTTLVREIPPRSRQAAAPRLEAVKRSLSKTGFSGETVESTAASQAQSTKSVSCLPHQSPNGMVDRRKIL